MAGVVLWTYASAWSAGVWPPSQPWSGITLSLLALQNFLPLKKNGVSWFVTLAGLAAAIVWWLSAWTASRGHARSKEANAPPQWLSTEGLAGSAPRSAAEASTVAAATAALTEAARLASFCQPKDGPRGTGKVRVVYAQDGSVQSVDMLSDAFRDTLTGSCINMAFRRAKIPAFAGPAPTFVKSFSVPAE